MLFTLAVRAEPFDRAVRPEPVGRMNGYLRTCLSKPERLITTIHKLRVNAFSPFAKEVKEEFGLQCLYIYGPINNVQKSTTGPGVSSTVWGRH